MTRRLNYRFLAGLTIAAVVAAATTAAVHAWQIHGQAAFLAAEAGRAEGAGASARAAEYLKRYLVYAPNDVDALERYGRLSEQLAQTAADRKRPSLYTKRRLRRDPERQAVRRAAIDLAMKQGDYFQGAKAPDHAAPPAARRRRVGGVGRAV